MGRLQQLPLQQDVGGVRKGLRKQRHRPLQQPALLVGGRGGGGAAGGAPGAAAELAQGDDEDGAQDGDADPGQLRPETSPRRRSVACREYSG